MQVVEGVVPLLIVCTIVVISLLGGRSKLQTDTIAAYDETEEPDFALSDDDRSNASVTRSMT